MISEELLDLLNEVDGDLLRRSEDATATSRKPFRMPRWVLSAACYFLVSVGLLVSCLYLTDRGFFVSGADQPSHLDHDTGVGDSVDIDSDPSTDFSSDPEDLSGYTEAEVVEIDSSEIDWDQVYQSVKFELYDNRESTFFLDQERVFFSGTIVETQNVRVNYGLRSETYSVISLSVDSIYAGDVSASDTVRVFYPYPVNENENGATTSMNGFDGKFTIGSRVILAPQKSSNRYLKFGNFVCHLESLADYRLLPTSGDVFIENEDGLSYSSVYCDLGMAQSLSDVESYIKNKIKEYRIER